MKFLVDAHISMEMVRMLRGAGHDCLDSSAIPARMLDVDVLKMAADQGRVLWTADKDFGELVYVHKIPCPGVVLIRLRVAREAERVAEVQNVLEIVLSRLPGSFVTISEGGIRVRPLG